MSDKNISLEKLGINPDWAKLPLFDRSKWQRVRFGDVVENVNETERDPAAAGIERFIAMEHLEPGSLHVRTWGNVADGTTFTRRCRPGQVLFGKRRAYQRKVAVAEFDAVVSGDIYVFAPKDERLIPELLPFICMSDRFFEFAVETSAGSLSPRTNWSHLAQFEFGLPPLAQQRRMVDILLAAEEVATRYQSVRRDLDEARSASLEGRFAQFGQIKGARALKELATINYGLTLGGYRAALPKEMPYLRVANLQRDQFDLRDVKVIGCFRRRLKSFCLRMATY